MKLIMPESIKEKVVLMNNHFLMVSALPVYLDKEETTLEALFSDKESEVSKYAEVAKETLARMALVISCGFEIIELDFQEANEIATALMVMEQTFSHVGHPLLQGEECNEV